MFERVSPGGIPPAAEHHAEALEAAGHGQQPGRSVGELSGHSSGRPDECKQSAAFLDWGFPISGKALREIATDADLIPVLMSEKGDPLHVGRRYRTATPKMRMALAARDRHCLWPGCDRPPSWAQGNHERDWRHGGRTNVNEMGLVCQRHHTKLNRGWRLERLPDKRVVVHPP